MSDTTITEIGRLTTQLTEQCGWWDLHRTVDGRFVVKVTEPGVDRRLGRSKYVDDTCLATALAEAAKITFLPVVPRKPADADQVEVRKDGHRWKVVGRHGVSMWTTKTKREALDAIERYQARCRAGLDDWHDQWAHLVETGVEGVDYEWGS